MRAAAYAFVLCLFAALPAAAGELAAPEALTRAQAGQMTIIDVRTPDEWRQTGIAPGAKTANLNNPDGADAFVAEVLKAAGGNKAAPLGLICRSGNRSAKAVALLESRGFTNLSNIGEGMSGWLRRDLPSTPWMP
ncbi:MAG: rhodanese-like domain-containing protein [Magnetospirillum sp.]|nr:rhodanese-like domain-containing protein [Magnetospirillum sp.]